MPTEAKKLTWWQSKSKIVALEEQKGTSARHVTNTLGIFFPSFFRGVFSPHKTNKHFFLVKSSMFFLLGKSRRFFHLKFEVIFSSTDFWSVFSPRTSKIFFLLGSLGRKIWKTMYVLFFFVEVVPLPPPNNTFWRVGLTFCIDSNFLIFFYHDLKRFKDCFTGPR